MRSWRCGGMVGALLVSAAAAPLASMPPVTLVASKDSCLRGGSPDLNEGANPAIRLQSSGPNRGIVGFELSGVSLDGLLRATLVLTIDPADPPASWGTAGRKVDVQRVTQDWSEGNGKELDLPGSQQTRGTGPGVTWKCPTDADIANQATDCASVWNGGSFAPRTAAGVTITNGMSGEAVWDVTQDVQDGAGFGFVVKKELEGQSGNVRFHSRESGNPPRLVLEYEDTTPPAIAFEEPGDGVLYNVTTVSVSVAYADPQPGSGVAPATFTATLDGQPITAQFTVGATEATATLSGLAAGPHALTAAVSDADGNTSTAAASFTVDLSPVLTLPASKDSCLRGGMRDLNEGANRVMRVQSSGPNRGIVAFDLRGISPASLVRATLTMTIDDAEPPASWGSTGRYLDVHRLTAAWTEGNGMRLDLPNPEQDRGNGPGVTWDCATDDEISNQVRDCATAWQGGDAAAAPKTAPGAVIVDGQSGQVSWDVTQDVLAGAGYGFLVRKELEGQSGNVRFQSREAAAGPRLRLELAPGGDVMPPVVTISAPEDGATIVGPVLTVAVSYEDPAPGSGVETASFVAILSAGSTARDVTADFTVGAAQATGTVDVSGGGNGISITIADAAGNLGHASASFTVVQPGNVRPSISVTVPAPGHLTNDATPPATITYAANPLGGALDLASFRATVDGQDVTGSFAVGPAGASGDLPPLADGSHTLEATIADVDGRAAVATVAFETDTQPPVIAISGVAEGALAPGEVTLTISVTDPHLDPGGTDATLDGRLFGSGGRVTTDGPHVLLVTATDRAGNASSASRSFAIDATPPQVFIVVPQENELVGATVDVAGAAIDGNLASVTIDGLPATLDGASFMRGGVPVAGNPATITVVATDLAGHATEETVTVRRPVPAPFDVSITSPPRHFVSGIPSVSAVVAYTSPQPPETLDLGTFRAVLDGNDVTTLFSAGASQATATLSSLRLGVHTLVASIADTAGRRVSASTTFSYDQTRPTIVIHEPVDGDTVVADAVTVTGMVEDLAPGTVNGDDVTVTVNGISAQVAHRAFIARGVPLVGTDNVITAEAVDGAGNAGTSSVRVTRAGPAGVRMVSGDDQSAPVRTELGAPLVVEVRDALDQPVDGVNVVFRVIHGDGRLGNGRRAAVVPTVGGRASVTFTLGSRAGAGLDRVRAIAVGHQGKVVFAASGLASAPDDIHVVAGDDQRGGPGQTLPVPLSAIVMDAATNPLPGVDVELRVTKGGGLVDGATAKTVTTDSDGVAWATLALGQDVGWDNVVVEAHVAGAVQPAVFKASTVALGPAEQTRIKGVVLDNQGDPVSGVTMRVLGVVPDQTDSQGQFELAGVPVGRVHLIADSSTASPQGSWASLEYEMDVLPGAVNELPKPIYILPVEVGTMVGTSDVTLTIPEVPGVALKVKGNSATFPGGSKSGMLSLTQVHADKIPMPPGSGMQPRLMLTLQPPGVVLDPPAELTYPNVDGHPPGYVTEAFSFDHDIGMFVSAGTVMVTEDGTALRSEPGFGIVKSGWQCASGANFTGSCEVPTLRVLEPDRGAMFLSQELDFPTKYIVVQGTPKEGNSYSISISDPAIATVDPIGSGRCPNDDLCIIGVTANKPGVARVTIAFAGLIASVDVFVADPQIVGRFLNQDEAANERFDDLPDVSAGPEPGNVLYAGRVSETTDHLDLAIRALDENGFDLFAVCTSAPCLKDQIEYFEWKVLGVRPTSSDPPESGPNVRAWDVGELTLGVRPELGVSEIGAAVKFSFMDEVVDVLRTFTIGARTDEIMIVAVQDAAVVPLPNAPDPDIEEFFVDTPWPASSAEAVLCQIVLDGLSMGRTSFDVPSPPARRTPIDLDLGPDPQANRNRILSWAFRRSANPSQFAFSGVCQSVEENPPRTFVPVGRTAWNESCLSEYLIGEAYQVVNRLQVKYTVDDRGEVASVKSTQRFGGSGKSLTRVAHSAPPYMTPPSPPFQRGPYDADQRGGMRVLPDRVQMVNDASPSAAEIRIFNTLTRLQGVSWENIGSRIEFRLFGETSDWVIATPASAWPTYFLYVNGVRIVAPLRGPSLDGQFFERPYPFGLGGRNGDAGSPPGDCGGMHIPSYVQGIACVP